MAGRVYDKIPIVDTARRCGLVLDSRTLRREEVEASCPFCGDHGAGKHHLSLNTVTDQYRCNLCGASGNSVTMYARLMGVSTKEAYQALKEEGKVYPMPQQPTPQNTTERQPLSLEQRHLMYTDMLEHLTLQPAHEDNLLERGLDQERIQRNQYRSMPQTERGRRLLAALLRSCGHDLLGLPGFRTYYGEWTLSGPNGFLIPVRDKKGLIQGLKIRLDDGSPDRKYRWLSSRGLPGGTRSYSWVHVTGDTSKKRAFLTEGPLKGDVASFLAQDALFVCIGGVNAIHGLKDTLIDLGVTEVVEAMDMDQMTNERVRKAILAIRQEVQSIRGIKYSKYTWNPAYKGVDDYLLSRAAV